MVEKYDPSTLYEQPPVFGLSWLQVVTFLLAGIGHATWAVLNKKLIYNGHVSYDVALVRDDVLDRIFFVSFNPDLQRVVSTAKWFLLGAVIYIIGWVVVVVIVNTFDDILISEAFIHPSSFNSSRYWTAIMGRTLLRVAAAILLLATAFLFLQLLPEIYVTISHSSGVLSAGVALLITAQFLYLYLSAIFIRFMLLKRRVF